MRRSYPYILKEDIEEPVICAGGQLIGGRTKQKDSFAIFRNECVVVADGVGGMPHGDIASRLAVETAIWGYKQIRLRPFYWRDKKLFIKRIFRSTNLAVWQKQKEDGYSDGLATTLSVIIIGSQKCWAGTVGDSRVILYRDGLIDFLTPPDANSTGFLTRAIGTQRLGIIPHIAVERFVAKDIIIAATNGITDFISEDEMRAICEICGDTKESLSNAVEHIITSAGHHGSTDNMTVVIVKRLRSSIT